MILLDELEKAHKVCSSDFVLPTVLMLQAGCGYDSFANSGRRITY